MISELPRVRLLLTREPRVFWTVGSFFSAFTMPLANSEGSVTSGRSRSPVVMVRLPGSKKPEGISSFIIFSGVSRSGRKPLRV